MAKLILITGGARSGKSDFAETLARDFAGDDVVFVATAEAGDDDMARRIDAHRRSRPAAWRTVETPRDVGHALSAALPSAVALVDCVTLLVSNVMLASADGDAADAVAAEIESLMAAVDARSGTVVLVTNEVGLGIVPDNRLARLYRDLLGRANSSLARRADAVYLLVSGLPIDIKKLANR